MFEYDEANPRHVPPDVSMKKVPAQCTDIYLLYNVVPARERPVDCIEAGLVLENRRLDPRGKWESEYTHPKLAPLVFPSWRAIRDALLGAA